MRPASTQVTQDPRGHVTNPPPGHLSGAVEILLCARAAVRPGGAVG